MGGAHIGACKTLLFEKGSAERRNTLICTEPLTDGEGERAACTLLMIWMRFAVGTSVSVDPTSPYLYGVVMRPSWLKDTVAFEDCAHQVHIDSHHVLHVASLGPRMLM